LTDGLTKLMAAVGANKITNGRRKDLVEVENGYRQIYRRRNVAKALKTICDVEAERQQRSVTKRLTVAGSNPAKRKHRRAGLDTSHDVHAPKF